MPKLDFSIIDGLTLGELQEAFFAFWLQMEEEEEALLRFISQRNGCPLPEETANRRDLNRQVLGEKSTLMAARLKAKDLTQPLFSENDEVAIKLKVLPRLEQYVIDEMSLPRQFKDMLVSALKEAIASLTIKKKQASTTKSIQKNYASVLAWFKVVSKLAIEEELSVAALLFSGLYWEEIARRTWPRAVLQGKMRKRLIAFAKRERKGSQESAVFKRAVEGQLSAALREKSNPSASALEMVFPTLLATFRDDEVNPFWKDAGQLVELFIQQELARIYGVTK